MNAEYYQQFINGFKISQLAENKKRLMGSWTKEFKEHIIQNIKPDVTHIFEITPELKKILLTTKPPTYKDDLKLPFDSTFIEVQITKDEIESQLPTNQRIILDPEINIVGVLACNSEFGIRITTMINTSKEIFFDTHNTNPKVANNYVMRETVNITRRTDGILKRIQQQVLYNLLAHLHHPLTQTVTVERSTKNVQKRLKKGKEPLPVSHVVRITGIHKIYANQLNQMVLNKHTHKWWVRGHWRHYKRSEPYNTWIAPYIKGTGKLVKKDYEVKR